MSEFTTRTRAIDRYKNYVLEEVDTQVSPMFESMAHKVADMPSDRYLVKSAIWELIRDGELTMNIYMILRRTGGHDEHQQRRHGKPVSAGTT